MLGVQEILNRLDAPRRTGADRWMARCPAHDDQTPSLSVKNGEGNILLNCFAGCDFEDVVRALGLEKSDLYHDNGASGSGSREVIDTHDYTNEDGDPLYRVVRTCPPKGFYQQRWNGSGGWANGLGDTRRVLFWLPEVIEAIALEKLIHVVEGEKDVHAVEHAGGIATCNPMGAGNWRDEYSDILRGARVRVIADDDESGIKRAHAVAKSLHGFAELVEILQAAKGKDASDHCEAGFGLDDFVPLTDETSPDEPGEPGPKLYPLVSDLEAEDLPAPEWGIDDIYPHGGFVVLFGPRGKCKTLLALGWSFCHAAGLVVRRALPGSPLLTSLPACITRPDNRRLGTAISGPFGSPGADAPAGISRQSLAQSARESCGGMGSASVSVAGRCP